MKLSKELDLNFTKIIDPSKKSIINYHINYYCITFFVYGKVDDKIDDLVIQLFDKFPIFILSQ